MTKWTAKTCDTIREHPAPRGQKEGTPLFSGAPSWFSMKKSVCGICVVRWKGQIFAQFFRNKTSKNPPFLRENGGFLVRVAGFEPTASWTRTMRATNCATPGYWKVLIYYTIFL